MGFDAQPQNTPSAFISETAGDVYFLGAWLERTNGFIEIDILPSLEDSTKKDFVIIAYQNVQKRGETYQGTGRTLEAALNDLRLEIVRRKG